MPAPHTSEDPLDPVEALLGDCLRAPLGERSRAVEEACAAHPEHARELRARVAALDALGVSIDAQEADAFPEELGDFCLLRRLGGGGMGVVYLARQVSLGRDVALKLVRPEQLYFPKARERFRREAEAIARLQHPNIVPIYTIGEHLGVPYFAMERVHGASLAELVAALHGRDPSSLRGRDLVQAASARSDAAPVPPRESWVDACVDVCLQVARALQHAHARGVLHRDVKPSNILLTPDGRALLCDFGLTSDPGEERLTRTGGHVGTLPYMSPEQAAGERELDVRADVYALGVTLYELLTLQLPYKGDSTAETMQLLRRGEPDPIRARNRRVAEDVETVCLTAMERDPGRRYASVEAFADDLTALLERRPIRARRPGSWLRARRWVQRHRALATGLALGGALLVALPTGSWWHQRQLTALAQASAHELGREARTTKGMNTFLLGLFRRAASTVPAGEPLRAEHVLEFGARAIEQDLADEPLVQARAALDLGRTLLELRRSDLAEPLIRSALATFEAAPADSHERRGLRETRMTLLELHLDAGRSAEARALLDTLRASLAERPPEDPLLMENTRLLESRLLLQEGEVERAVALMHDVIACLEVRGGDRRPLAAALGELGNHLLRAGRAAEALPPLERSLAALDAELGGRHPDLVAALNNLALAHKRVGQLSQARDAMGRAAEMAESLWTTANANTAVLWINAGALADQSEDPERALAYYERACAAYAGLGETDSFNALLANISRGAMLLEVERFAEAQAALEEWQPRQAEHLGPQHAAVAVTRRRRAACHAALGERARALELIDEALLHLQPGDEHGALRRDLQELRAEYAAEEVGD